ncbi:MAG: ribonuclease HII [Bacillota bacterium]|nr:ribonuclease HII [Bacillota bacterium]
MSIHEMTIAEIKEMLADCEELSSEDEALLKADARRGVEILLHAHYRKIKARENEKLRLKKMLSFENNLYAQGYRAIAGVDEAGRGPLAGPVVAAAVILKKDSIFPGLNDSKQLTAAVRERLFEQIVVEAEAYSLGRATREEIDRLNIHAASMLAMIRAINGLRKQPDYLLVDGFRIRNCPLRQEAIKSGDTLSLSIAAASVLAKVARDKIMQDLHDQYPQYGFNRNMGYGTEAHRSALSEYGPCPEHRCSFKLI